MLENRESVEAIYKHFGEAPYWSEAGSENFPTGEYGGEYASP
jgi:hypothetical protein